MTSATIRARENAVRKSLRAHGLRLCAGRPKVYGIERGYMIATVDRWAIAGAHPYAYSMSLEDIEEYVAPE